MYRPEIQEPSPMIAELALANMPTHAELLASLMAYRHAMPGGSRHVWLCVDDEHGWSLVDQPTQLVGAYARCTVGKGDHNLALHDAATTLIAHVRDYLEAIPA